MSAVNHPSHYNTGNIEVIDFLLDQKFGFLDGNVVKYMCRFRHKGNPIQDLEKAKWYLECLIAQTKKEQDGNNRTD